MKKTIITLTALLATTLGAAAQNTTEMSKDTVRTVMQSIENGVVSGYKAIENGVVSGYTAIQDGVVEGFTRISDAFVKKFLMRDGETLEEAKARIAREEEELHRQNQERVAASRQHTEETSQTAKKQ